VVPRILEVRPLLSSRLRVGKWGRGAREVGLLKTPTKKKGGGKIDNRKYRKEQQVYRTNGKTLDITVLVKVY